MNTNETGKNEVLEIRTVSGGERGVKGSGVSYRYTLAKKTWLDLAERVFLQEVKESKAENAKSGGLVAQMLHAYGVNADKVEKAGNDPFPPFDGLEVKAFGEAELEEWFNVLNYKAERVKVPLEERQKAWDAKKAEIEGLKVYNVPEAVVAKMLADLGKRPSA